jgi:hypothetical protein
MEMISSTRSSIVCVTRPKIAVGHSLESLSQLKYKHQFPFSYGKYVLSLLIPVTAAVAVAATTTGSVRQIEYFIENTILVNHYSTESIIDTTTLGELYNTIPSVLLVSNLVT